MKVTLIDSPNVIQSNPDSLHNYFAWPTAVRMKNGNIAVASSGYRLAHVCPFGKTVLSVSNDDGKTFSTPMPVIDTPLDDRDGGLCVFGKSGLIVTSFNNSREFQRTKPRITDPTLLKYAFSYLDGVSDEAEKKYVGATFRVSFDNGITFGEIYKSPITSPHGPIELQDGRIFWLGKEHTSDNTSVTDRKSISAYTINPENGKMEYISSIDNLLADGELLASWEPYAFQTDDGTIIAHIRAQEISGKKYFTTFQSESYDNGKTWTKPRQILSDRGGTPSFIMKHSSGTLIFTYSYRGPEDYSVRVSFSYDNGKTWVDEQKLYINEYSADLGYPSTVELSDGSLMTVFYAHEGKAPNAVVMKQNWRIEK